MRELRIGLVLFGGVSLAVYINGIATELWQALRASRAQGSGPRPDGTAGVYYDLLKALAQRPDAGEIRIVVDAIAGTSAGGVNGGALAKAIVDGGDASVLNTVWIEQADFAALKNAAPQAPWTIRTALWTLGFFRTVRELREKVEALPGITWAWVRDAVYAMLTSKDGSFTPLNGGYFTRMIARAYRDMATSGTGDALLPRRGTFDLALTRTDIQGWPRHLPVSPVYHPAALYERTHAHVMHFRRSAAGERLDDDFGLTYATRSTASFPGAFPAVAYPDIADDYRGERPGDPVPDPAPFTRRHLREHDLAGFPAGTAWMIDGGVLDNKPFSYVARAIEDKPADHQVYRVVAYVEPDPAGAVVPSGEGRPGPYAMVKHLYGLSRHEPIYGDLRELDARNDKVERIREIRDADRPDAEAAARAAGGAAGLSWPPTAAEFDRWREITNAAVATARGAGYAGYTALKARRAASIAADAICRALEYPYASRQAYFVRRLVRAWLAGHGALVPPIYADGTGYTVGPAQLALLKAFDLPYRQRRIRALVQAVNRSYDAIGEERRPASPEERGQLDACKRALADIAFGYAAAFRDTTGLADRVRQALGATDGDALDRRIAELAADIPAAMEQHADALAGTYEALLAHFTASGREQNGRIAEAVALLPASEQAKAAVELAVFPFLDLATFPMMDAADVTDLITVETMRVSPTDATFLSDDPFRLKSRGLGAFAGFLDRSAREHDLLWGRLDGVERLVELILRGATGRAPDGGELAELRREYTRRAMRAVLDAEAARGGSAEVGRVIESLRERLDTV